MAKNKGGRPPKHNRKECLEKILEQMAKGDRNLKQICKDDPGLPHHGEIYRWLDDKELCDIFTRAQELWCWAQKDICMEIADDDSKDVIESTKETVKEDGTSIKTVDRRSDNTAVNRANVRIRTRMWAMERLLRKIFGEKVEHTGADGGPIQYQTVVDRPGKETPEQWQLRVQKQIEEKAKANQNLH